MGRRYALSGLHLTHTQYLVGPITQASAMEPLSVNIRDFLPKSNNR